MEALSEKPHPPSFARHLSAWVVMPAVSLLLYAGALALLARLVDIGSMPADSARFWLAGSSIAAGAIYLICLHRVGTLRLAIPTWWIMACAVAARLVVGSAPALIETDYYRYFWDGAVVAHGVNPYRHAPADVLAGAVAGTNTETLRALAHESGAALERVNHPNLTTIYPPLAQIWFAVAYWVQPFGITGWRVVLCLADALATLLLARTLKALSLPAHQMAWLAWNPLLLREVYSALHMDMLALPLVAGAVYAAVRSRHTIGATLCVAASAVKVWPIVLTPLLLRPLLGEWRRLAISAAACAILFGLLWFPVFLVPQGQSSGFLAYGATWQNNDGFFRAGIWLTEIILSTISAEPWRSHRIMRIVAASLLLAVVLSQCLRRIERPGEVVGRALVIVGAIFLLSPTQFPWYWLWCLPMLAIRPSLPLLLYVALLPLFYIQSSIPLVYWIEHGPVWSLLIAVGARGLRGRGAGAKPDPEAGCA